MTLAHVAALHSRTTATMYHATSPAVPGDARARVEAHAATHGWPLVVDRCAGARRRALRRQPGGPLLLLQEQSVRPASPRATDDTIASGTNRRRPRRLPPGPARRHASATVVHPYVEAGIDQGRHLRDRASPRPRRPRAPAGAAVPREPRGDGHRDRSRRPRVHRRRGERSSPRRSAARPRCAAASRTRGVVIELGDAEFARHAGRRARPRAARVRRRRAHASPACGPMRAAPRSCTR